MNRLMIALLLFSLNVAGQVSIISGKYRELNLAFDTERNIITGFYENTTGYDEEIKAPKFSCAFYIEGKLSANKIKIKTYFPLYIKDDMIVGDLIVSSNKEIKLHLPEEHGGCWNVVHFADENVAFSLDKAENWIQIRYANIDKVYFHSNKSNETRQKAFIIKGDVVYIEKIEGQWAFCIYEGNKITKGWIKLDELNQL